LKAVVVVAVLPAMVLCATLQLAAKEPDPGYRLPKGTKAVFLRLDKDQEVPRNAEDGMEVDIVGEISDPVKTGIALLNVKLLSYDPKWKGKEQVVLVQLTAAQEEVLALMEKHGMKLGMKLCPKEKPKR